MYHSFNEILPEPTPQAGMVITAIPAASVGEAGFINRHDFSNAL